MSGTDVCCVLSVAEEHTQKTSRNAWRETIAPPEATMVMSASPMAMAMSPSPCAPVKISDVEEECKIEKICLGLRGAS